MTNKNEIDVQMDSRLHEQLQKLAEQRGIDVGALATELAREELVRRTIPRACSDGVVSFRRAKTQGLS